VVVKVRVAVELGGVVVQIDAVAELFVVIIAIWLAAAGEAVFAVKQHVFLQEQHRKLVPLRHHQRSDNCRLEPLNDVAACVLQVTREDRKSTRLNSSHVKISYAVFCLKKKRK